jgi:hypothetical protein
MESLFLTTRITKFNNRSFYDTYPRRHAWLSNNNPICQVINPSPRISSLLEHRAILRLTEQSEALCLHWGPTSIQFTRGEQMFPSF